MWEAFMEVAPFARSVEVVTNALRWFALAILLVTAMLGLLIIDAWGFSEGARLSIIGALLVILVGEGVAVVSLARHPKNLLYSPYERSLRQGRRFGNEVQPMTRAEIDDLTKTTGDPQLSPPPDPPSDTKQLTGE